ncbi:formylglycine-generating enzyme family protein [Shivajiella indica]|uniref:SUMF1/EgtB/PvdO family nonheme iron enzyme n=1 Tax=Shivajiella indica TaxID=872115 RepID=A0ABW5BBG5_9BACT
MNEQKALELLDLEPSASSSEIRRAYQEIYNELQIRLTNAPTEHQKELYRKRLAAVEEAYLFLGGEREEDLSELPSMGPVENTSEEKVQATKPQPITEAAALELLGLSKPFYRGRLVDAYKGKKEDFEKGLKSAPNELVKQGFIHSLKELEEAFLLLEPIAESPAPVPPKTETPKPQPEKKKTSSLLWAIPVILLLAAGIWFFLPKGEKQDEISQELKVEFIRIKGQADLLAEQQDWYQALEKYQEVYALIPDKEVNDSIKSMEQRLAALAKDTQDKEQAEAEAKDWAAAQRSNSAAGYLDFIKKYPSGTYKAQAEQKIRDLEKLDSQQKQKNEKVIQDLVKNMVFVEGGTFIMGCTPEQGDDCYDFEFPSHSITLSNYYIGKYEITHEQWYAIMGYYSDYYKNWKCDKCPVDGVSWPEIPEFIKRLNQLTGKRFRLPTEAEWEFAARGGNKSKGYKYSGSNDINLVAWYEGNSNYKPHPVGLKQANELGIHDMTGNMCEWCNDTYEKYTEQSKTNPQAIGTSEWRINRGGRYPDTPKNSRNSYRDSLDPKNRNYYLCGFRLVLPV